MSKESSTWTSERLGRELTLVRWGDSGVPVLVFPTAGGDAEEIERFHLVASVSQLLAAGRIKIYSVDSVAGRYWLAEDNSSHAGARMQLQYDAAVLHEVLPAIRRDCQDDAIEILAAGASIGAYNALAFLCRHPEVCRGAICMSGTYGLEKFLQGPVNKDYYEISPLHFVPDLGEGDPRLQRLRQRFVLLAHGQGRAESPEEDWRVATVLGRQRIPNRVDPWGETYPHDWETWREMLPKYLEECLDEGPAASTPSP